MKRSEMVKKISEFISESESYYYKNGVTFPEYAADDLLTYMENLGMKPPVEETCPVLFTSKHTWTKEDGEAPNNE